MKNILNPTGIVRSVGLAALISFILVPVLQAASIWNGGGTDNNWSTGGNWGGTAPASSIATDIQFGGTTRLSPVVDSAYTMRTLTFNPDAGAFTLSGSDLSVNGVGPTDTAAITNRSMNTQTISNGITLLGGFGFFANSGNMVLRGGININNNGVRFTASSGRTLTVSGIISGTTGNSVSFNDSGTVVVTGNNTYTAKTTLWNGTVLVGANALQNAISGAFGNTSATTDKNIYLGFGTGTGNVALLTNGAYQIDRQLILVSNANTGYSYTIGGATADTSSFSQNIRLGDGATASSVILTAAAGGTVDITGAFITPAGITTGVSNLTKTGTGTVILSSAGGNGTTGATSILQGILAVKTLTNGGLVSSIGMSSSVSTNLVLNGGTLQYLGETASTDRLFSVGTNNGGLDSSGTGAVNLTNTGAMGFNGQAGARTLTLSGTNAGNNILAAAIGDNSGATTVVKAGTGQWVLSGSNSYSGGTNIREGVFVAASNQAAGTGGIALSGGQLTVEGGVALSNNVTFTNAASFYNLARATGDSYAAYRASSHLGGIDTTAWVRNGVVSVAAGTQTLATSFATSRSVATNDSTRISDVFTISGFTTLSGTQTDIFALQLNVASGLPDEGYMAWLNSSNQWVNATDGNTGAGTFAGFYQMSYDDFLVSQGGSFNGAAMLGAYGVDDSGNAWAVLNHGGDFTVVPEPRVLAFLGFGLAMLWIRSRRRLVNG